MLTRSVSAGKRFLGEKAEQMHAEKAEKWKYTNVQNCMVYAFSPESEQRYILGDNKMYVPVELGKIWARYLHFGM